MNFITLVLAFVVAQLITGCVAMAIITNRRVINWCIKKYSELAVVAFELEDLI